MIDTRAGTASRPVTAARAGFTLVNWLVVVGVVVQGLSGGGLVGHLGHAWSFVHEIAATGVILLALAGTVLAVIDRRTRDRRIVTWSAVLTALVVAQVAIGVVLADGHRTLLVVHVPVALLIMALGALLGAAGRPRRAH